MQGGRPTGKDAGGPMTLHISQNFVGTPPKGKGKSVCSMEVFFDFHFCVTCVRGNVVNAVLSTRLLQGSRQKCQRWFVVLDKIVRSVLSIVQAGQIIDLLVQKDDYCKGKWPKESKRRGAKKAAKLSAGSANDKEEDRLSEEDETQRLGDIAGVGRRRWL